MEAFCVRCRKMVEMRNEKVVKFQNGRYAKKGTCPECSSKVVKTISRPKNFMEKLLFFLPEPGNKCEEEKEEEKKEKKGQGQPAPD